MGVKTLVRLAFVFSVFWIGTQGFKCYICAGPDTECTGDEKFLKDCGGAARSGKIGCTELFIKNKDGKQSSVRACEPGMIEPAGCTKAKGPTARAKLEPQPGQEAVICACYEEGCNKNAWNLNGAATFGPSLVGISLLLLLNMAFNY